MTSSTSPDPTPDPLQEILAVLKQIEAHMAALRNAFVPTDMRGMRFDYDKDRS